VSQIARFRLPSTIEKNLKSLSFNENFFCDSGPSAAFNTYMKATRTDNSIHAPGEYRIEISGWGADSSFFVERANLVWRSGGEEQVRLLRALPEGAMIFVRSISSDPSNLSVPVAYKVKTVMPRDSQGGYPMDVVQMHPRGMECKESLTRGIASNKHERKRQCETNESGMTLEVEEILR
jgi:hypothetical protein